MRRWSPYNFTFNNPLRFIDPDGMAPDEPVSGNSKEKRSVKKYARKFNRILRRLGGNTEANRKKAHEKMEEKYNNSHWMWIEKKSNSGYGMGPNPNAGNYYHAGDIFRYQTDPDLPTTVTRSLEQASSASVPVGTKTHRHFFFHKVPFNGSLFINANAPLMEGYSVFIGQAMAPHNGIITGDEVRAISPTESVKPGSSVTFGPITFDLRQGSYIVVGFMSNTEGANTGQFDAGATNVKVSADIAGFGTPLHVVFSSDKNNARLLNTTTIEGLINRRTQLKLQNVRK